MNHRNTKQRQAILEAIERHGGHLTADDVYKMVRRRYRRLSLGTVYRNLRVLATQGVVRELDFGMSVSYFETMKNPHHHLICRICRRITDAKMPIERRLATLIRRAPVIDGFQIEEHRLDLIGVCADCQEQGPKSHKPKRTVKAPQP